MKQASAVHARVQAAPFDVGAELAALLASANEDGAEGAGGIGCFVGVVRGEAGRVSALTLEHYPGMTEAMMLAEARAASARWGLLGVRVVHRVGRLAVGEPIVLVLCASARREAALAATAHLIGWLKSGAPIWKREIFVDGGEGWVAAAG